LLVGQKRAILTYMYDRLLTERIHSTKRSVLLLGPRQTGKSTLMATASTDLKFDLSDEGLFLQLSKDPGLFKRQILAALDHRPFTVFVDEIQRLPPLLNTIQHLIDGKGIRFLLTGSSARKLRREDANLLPGRVIRESLTPLTVQELGSEFDLEYALQLGMLPFVWADREGAVDRLGSYSEIYLREEIRAESLVRNIGDFARFLDIAAISSGSWLNYSKLSSDTEIPKETIRRFFALLVDTLLVYRLENFRPKVPHSRRVPQRERYFFFDVGVRNSLLKTHRFPISPEIRGFLFEQWMILQVLYTQALNKNILEVKAYIDDRGREVDLIVELQDEVWGIEIKSGTKADDKQHKGLLAFKDFAKNYKPVRLILCYCGDTPQKFEDGVLALPYNKILNELLAV